MSILLQAADIAVKMKTCYDQRVALFDFDGATDTCVEILRDWMPHHDNNALLAATACIGAWNEKHPNGDDGPIIHGFMAAAYFIIQIQPHEHTNISAH